MADRIATGLEEAALKGFGRLGRGTDRRKSRNQEKKVEDFGLFVVGLHSDDEDIAWWETRLWESQDELIHERSKEWRMNLLYCAGNQYIAYHKVERRWIPRKAAPWRLRSLYNVVQKAVNLRVSRLTENKPMITVQSATTDAEDVERAEFKETLFWSLWKKLRLHVKLAQARRWASKTGSGFLKVWWDPDAGPPRARTKFILKEEQVERPVLDPVTQQPGVDPVTGEAMTEMVREVTGIEEVYLDVDGNELGPVEDIQDDNARIGAKTIIRNPIPEKAEMYHDGEISVTVLSPFNLRWDRYADDPSDSWYVQESEIMPLTALAAIFPKKLDDILQSDLASEDEVLYMHRAGLTQIQTQESSIDYGQPGRSRGTDAQSRNNAPLDKEFVVRRTWIWPQNDYLKRLWGEDGALIVTVGGTCVHKSGLPKWALLENPFIRFIDTEEEGNHYAKSFLRDLMPLQDDINRSRSHWAEKEAISSRLILGAPQNHQINVRTMANLPGAMVTYRSPQHEPKPIAFANGTADAENFYSASLQAAQDVASMNDASTGKLPSAALAARAIYALQFADEKSVAEASNAQDEALVQLARIIDAIVRVEYTEMRKIEVVGDDRGYMVYQEVRPEKWQSDVDYQFVPGSMLSKNKEAIRNEMIQLLQLGLVSANDVKQYLSTAVPDIFRRSYDLHESKARRVLTEIVRGVRAEYQPQPWDKAEIFIGIFEEYMQTVKFELLDDSKKQKLILLWQQYAQIMQQQRMMHMQEQVQLAQLAGKTTAAAKPPTDAPQTPVPPQEEARGRADAGFNGLAGAQGMQQQATDAMQPPDNYGSR
jgi:hypothetical protein